MYPWFPLLREGKSRARRLVCLVEKLLKNADWRAAPQNNHMIFCGHRVRKSDFKSTVTLEKHHPSGCWFPKSDKGTKTSPCSLYPRVSGSQIPTKLPFPALPSHQAQWKPQLF